MSEEHYPAKCTGNDDVVAFDIAKMFDLFQSGRFQLQVNEIMNNGKSREEAIYDIFDNELAKPLYPKGRTNLTLCKECNTFLGKYDEAYLKFFDANGDPQIVKNYTIQTRIRIIKSIFAKFLSVPEAQNESFDFLNFVRNDSCKEYNGDWQLYFIKRDFSTDLAGFNSIETGKIAFDEGVVYEMSDNKFIYDLMNFEKHSVYDMNNIFDILNKNYRLVVGAGESGGYHSRLLMCKLFEQLSD